jgi:hypothetical protein
MVAGTITAPNASFPARSFAAALRIFTIRQFPEFSERFCDAIVHPEARFLRIGSFKNKGCGNEDKDPRGRLLSEDTFGSEPCVEAP